MPRVFADLAYDDADFKIFTRLEAIITLNESIEMPATVNKFVNDITASDAVFIYIQEYALGLPGALKNVLDWTVATIAFSSKPVALITAASGGEKAHAAFSLTPTALGTKISEETKLLIPFISTKLNEEGEITDITMLTETKRVTGTLMQNIESWKLTNSQI